MADKQRKCAVCSMDMLPWDNHQACIKCRGEKKGKDKCVTGKEGDCHICAGSLKIPHKKKSKSKSSDKFDDSLLDEPTPSKSSQPNPPTPDPSLQELIKNMSSQLASLTSQFEELKRKDKPPTSLLPQEQGLSAPASQSRTEPSEGELSDEGSLPSLRKRRRSRSPQDEGESHQQELDPSYVEMLNAIRGLLDLEVPQVECLVAPSAFSKKPSKQVVRKQNLALPPVQDIKTMWEYRFRKASGTTLKDKASSESLSQGHFLAFERPDMIYYTTSPQEMSLKSPKVARFLFQYCQGEDLISLHICPFKAAHYSGNCLQGKCTDSWTCGLV